MGKKWTEAEAIKFAKENYGSRTDLHKFAIGCYLFLKRHNLLDQVYPEKKQHKLTFGRG